MASGAPNSSAGGTLFGRRVSRSAYWTCLVTSHGHAVHPWAVSQPLFAGVRPRCGADALMRLRRTLAAASPTLKKSSSKTERGTGTSSGSSLPREVERLGFELLEVDGVRAQLVPARTLVVGQDRRPHPCGSCTGEPGCGGHGRNQLLRASRRRSRAATCGSVRLLGGVARRLELRRTGPIDPGGRDPRRHMDHWGPPIGLSAGWCRRACAHGAQTAPPSPRPARPGGSRWR